MTRQSWRAAGLAAALLLAPWLTVARAQNPAAPAKDADKPAAQARDAHKPEAQARDAAQDIVFLAEARPLLLRLHVRVDGAPVQAAWDGFMKHLFRHLDRNNDGVLDKDEAARAPALDHILSGNLGAGALGGFRMGGGAKVPPLTGRDGKVTPAELAAYYRKQGFVPFQLQSQAKPFNPIAAFLGGGKSEPSVKAVSDAIFNLLDTDRDGKLTRAELAAAAAALLPLDANDDELLTAGELVPATGQSGGGMAGGMMGGPGRFGPGKGLDLVLLVAMPGEAPAGLVQQLQQRYGKGGKLDRKALGLDEATFAALDTNRDGVLDAAELARFVKRAPDLELSVRLGTREETEGAVDVLTAKGRPAPLAGKVRTMPGLALLELGATRAELRVSDEYKADRLGGVLRQQYGAQFKQADKNGDGVIDEAEGRNSALLRGAFKAMDRDGDGKVSEQEFNAYLELLQQFQARARRACVTLVLSDESRGLFDLLDVDRDGRLSIREMRGAVGLLGKLDGGKGHLTRADLPHSYRLTVRGGPTKKGGFDLSAIFEDIYGGSYQAAADEGPAAGPEWFRKMDRNRDGDVSRREWLGSEELFRRIDTDGDGLISAAEATHYDALSRKQK